VRWSGQRPRFLTRSRRRRTYLVAATALTLALAVLVYRGPGWHFTRNHVGDVAAAMLVLAGLTFAAPRLRMRVLAPTSFAACTLVELGQTLWSGLAGTAVGEFVLGAVFDPIDLLAYALGTAIAGIALARPAHRLDDGR
jgi:hypothetical protein